MCVCTSPRPVGRALLSISYSRQSLPSPHFHCSSFWGKVWKGDFQLGSPSSWIPKFLFQKSSAEGPSMRHWVEAEELWSPHRPGVPNCPLLCLTYFLLEGWIPECHWEDSRRHQVCRHEGHGTWVIVPSCVPMRLLIDWLIDFGGYTWHYSEIAPGYAFRNHSWWAVDHMENQGLEPGTRIGHM